MNMSWYAFEEVTYARLPLLYDSKQLSNRKGSTRNPEDESGTSAPSDAPKTDSDFGVPLISKSPSRTHVDIFCVLFPIMIMSTQLLSSIYTLISWTCSETEKGKKSRNFWSTRYMDLLPRYPAQDSEKMDSVFIIFFYRCSYLDVVLRCKSIKKDPGLM